MREVVGAVVPPAQVAREEGLLLLEPRHQAAGLLEVSGVGDVLKFVEGTGEPGGRDECKASPGEQQQACDQDCAVHGLWCMDAPKFMHVQVLGATRYLARTAALRLIIHLWFEYAALCEKVIENGGAFLRVCTRINPLLRLGLCHEPA